MAKEKTELSGYDLSRAWFDWSFENPEKVSPNHSAIYFFAIEHCNRLGWKDKFGFPTQMVMDAIGIKKHQTYIKYFNELVEWGFLDLIQRSANQYSANIISLTSARPKKGKALDKALIKHGAKQTGTNGQSNSSIDKQENNEPVNNEQLIELEKNFDELETYEDWKIRVMKGHSLNDLQFKKLFDGFKTQCLISCEEKTIGGLQSFFARWIPVHKEKYLNLTAGKTAPVTKQGYGT